MHIFLSYNKKIKRKIKNEEEWNEDDHLRDDKGRFTEGGGEEGNSNEKELTEEGKDGTVQSSPKAKGFRNDRDREKHEVHVREMGYKNFEEYEKAARDFINDGAGENLQFKDERFRKYNKETNKFATYDGNGNIVTFFKPERKEEYWESQKNKIGVKNND